MPRVFAIAIAALSFVTAGCTGEESDHWASACTRVDLAKPLALTGTVAYAVDRRAGSELAVADLATRKVRRLTRQRSPHDSVGSIAWSPDGTRIAYSGGKGGWNDDAYDDIWVVSTRGGPPHRLTDSYEDDWHPAWSPDGEMLAFDRQDDGYNWVYVVNADGTGLRRLTGNFNWNPVWTPDGRISYVGDGGIWVVNRDGSNRRLLARAPVHVDGYGGNHMVWSPDGESIAFTSGTAMWLMSADGATRRKIFGDPNRQTGSPVWSPDGRSIAWTQGDGDLEIYVANRDGTGVRNITDNTGVAEEGPTWTPDGHSIVFSRTCGNRSRGFRYALLVADANGGEPAKLSEPPTIPVWAP